MRQHLTVEELKSLDLGGFICLYRKVRTSRVSTHRLYRMAESLQSGSGWSPEAFVKEITIGVLQAILLEAGYDVHIDVIIDPETYNHYSVTVINSDEYKCVDDQWCLEPVEFFFQAVKELVLKGVE